ncbi:hypothetical protein J2X61_002157, partial [Bacillus sp. 3255]|nr:hypothetical protein [Bacillus sp. 3255]
MAGNGIDDDGNGYIDDVSGFDFVNHDSTVFDGSNSDTHGTHVAGIIAAAANNEGIIGVAPHVKILPLKFIQGNYGYTSDAIEAIEYAKSIGVKIINCSWGGSEINPALKDAMENSGILFISASGNNGSDTAKQPIYPAAFGLPNVVSVTAVDNVGNLAPFSNYGNTVDLAAPGVNVLSTLPENNYGMMSGTSMAAPYGTGVAALLFSLNPSISAQEVKEKLKNNITTIPQLVGKVYSGGMLNAYKALTANAQSPWTPPSTTQPSTPSSGESLTTYPFAFKSNIENGRSVVTKFDLLDSASPYNKVQLIVSEVGNKTPIFNGYIDNNQKEIQLGYLAVDSHYSFNVKIVKGDIVESYVGQLKINLKNDPITNVPLAVQPNVSVYKSPIFMPLSVTQTVYGTTTQSVSSSVYSNVYGNSGNNSILSIRYEIEPDNSFSQAMLIYDDDDVYGVIGSTTDEDYYKVMFSNNGNANFWLGGIPYNRDYELKIYDDSYAQIYNSSNSGTSDELISNVLIQANRWYYIKVYGFNGSNDPGTNYHVRVKNYVGASPGDSYELNNSFSQAANRGSNSTTYANIHDSSDIDYYQFSLFTKSNVTINLNSIPTNADYDIKLYNSSQTQLYSSTNSGMSNENISLVLDAGTYYIKVYPYSGYSTSNYRLDISSTAALNPPSVSLNAPSNGTSYTLGQTVNISAIGVNTHHIAAFVKGPNDADYVWIANQTGTQFSYDYTPPITGSYSILVKARNGVDGDDSTTLVTSSSVSINVVGSQSEGSLDWITSNIIAGWAWQPSRPNDAIDVHIYINGQIKAVVKANQYRSDLVTAGKGNGYHGFSYQIDWSGYAPGTYQVVAYAVDGSGNNPSLGGSPKSWTVTPQSEGSLDWITSNIIAGWAWQPSRPNDAIDVHI